MLQPPKTINWTREKLDAFKAKHATVKTEFFRFEGHSFDFRYAGYLIIHLEGLLAKETA